MTHGHPRPPRLAFGLVGLLGALLGVLATLFVLRLLAEGAPAGDAPLVAAPGATAGGLAEQAADARDEPSPDAVRALDPDDSRRRAETLRVEVVRWPDGRPVAGARVAVRSAAEVLLDGVTTAQGAIACPVPTRRTVLDVTASAPRFETKTVLVRPDEVGPVLVELVPQDGWWGRVVLPTGEGVAGAAVQADRFWPPRPALMLPDGSDEPVLVSTEGSAPASATLRSDEDGWFYVEPCDTDNVVDLALAVVGERFASELLRVPLPRPAGELPPLVVRATEPLSVRVVWSDFRGAASARLLVDRGPSVRHAEQAVLVTDRFGRLALPRHLSRIALALDPEGRTVVERLVDGLPPRERDGWLELPGGARELVLRVDSPGRVRGEVFDASTNAPVDDGVARLLAPEPGGGRQIASARLRPDGTFDLDCDPAWKGEACALALEAPGYAAIETSVIVDPLPSEWEARLPFHLAPVPGALAIGLDLGRGPHGRRRGGELPAPIDAAQEPDPATVSASMGRLRVWIGPGWGGTSWQPLDDSYRLVRDEWVALDAPPTLRTTEPGTSLVALLLEVRGDDGRPMFATWGPRPLAEAARAPVPLRVSPASTLAVEVTGLREDSRYFLGRTTWHPWVDESASDWVWVSDGGRTRRELELPLAYDARTFLELRLDRGPVSASLARLTDWLSGGRGDDAVRLAAPSTYTVQGRVTWYAEAEWPDTCVGLLGEPVGEDRLDALGERDWCARPDKDGAWRIEGVPEGDYLLVLYRPVGDEGVEVLGQRPAPVRDDLFNLDVWPEAAGGAGRFVIAR